MRGVGRGAARRERKDEVDQTIDSLTFLSGNETDDVKMALLVGRRVHHHDVTLQLLGDVDDWTLLTIEIDGAISRRSHETVNTDS